MSCDRHPPDSCRGFHHQEHVHGVEEGPPEGGAEEQLDPHLQRQTNTSSRLPDAHARCPVTPGALAWGPGRASYARTELPTQ